MGDGERGGKKTRGGTPKKTIRGIGSGFERVRGIVRKTVPLPVSKPQVNKLTHSTWEGGEQGWENIRTIIKNGELVGAKRVIQWTWGKSTNSGRRMNIEESGPSSRGGTKGGGGKEKLLPIG